MNEKTVRIIAVGDLSFNGYYHHLLNKYGPGYPFQQVAARWEHADLRLGNLESPLTSNPRVCPEKLTLRGAPRSIDAIRDARIDCLSLANNHMMDYGPEGIHDTCKALSAAGIRHVGAGDTEAMANNPVIIQSNDYVIGVLAFCDVVQISPLYAGPTFAGVAKGEPDLCSKHINDLRPHVDWLIVQMHWGTELSQLPSPRQRDWARKMVAAGADLILGHHAHVLQPIEIIEEVPVAYSLGNFIFSNVFWRGCDQEGDRFVAKYRCHPLSRKTGWIEILLRKGKPAEIQFHPAWLTRRLVVAPQNSLKRRREWAALNSLLETGDYESVFDRESRRSQLRRDWQDSWKPLLRRLEVALFGKGLLPYAAVEF
jgi:hypothetical protein